MTITGWIGNLQIYDKNPSMVNMMLYLRGCEIDGMIEGKAVVVTITPQEETKPKMPLRDRCHQLSQQMHDGDGTVLVMSRPTLDHLCHETTPDLYTTMKVFGRSIIINNDMPDGEIAVGLMPKGAVLNQPPSVLPVTLIMDHEGVPMTTHHATIPDAARHALIKMEKRGVFPVSILYHAREVWHDNAVGTFRTTLGRIATLEDV